MNESQIEATKIKEIGNRLFKEKNYCKALEQYTKAIDICPNISVLYSNRSQCYRLLNDYENSYIEAEKALQIDDKNIKAYFCMGEALVQMAVNSKDKTKIQMAIQKLKKSLRLCPSQNKNEFEERFIDQIYKAKKKLWDLTVQQNLEKKKALRSFLVVVETDSAIDEDEKDLLNENITELLDKNLGQKQPVPKALICPITKKIMKDPVCNECGNSYSRGPYLNQIKENRLDPLTKKPLNSNILYSNINIKKAIEHFLQKNPWAYDEPLA